MKTQLPNFRSIVRIVFTVIFFISLHVVSVNYAYAQKQQKTPETKTTVKNKSAWAGNVNSQHSSIVETITAIPNTINKVAPKEKEAKPIYPIVENQKLSSSNESIEISELQDAYSKTFRNESGSFTKVQSNTPLYYKNGNGKWTSLNGKLTPNKTNPNLYEVKQTDLPISVDMSNGNIAMTLEQSKSISFGKNTELYIYNKELKEASKIIANKNTKANVSEKKFYTTNVWNNIDKQIQVDFSFTKTDYTLNAKQDYGNTDGYLVFKEAIEIPKGWQITKSELGTETIAGWQGDLIVINEIGIEVGRFHLPVYYDNSANASSKNETCTIGKKSEGEKSNIQNHSESASINGTYKLEKVAGKYFISVLVPINWLQSSERVYPITIDPTASNTYATGNIASCYYPTFNTATMSVTIPTGSTVTATTSQCTYTAVSPTWRSEGWIGFQSGSNLDGYYYCNNNSAGVCNVTGATNSTIANGTYSDGNVPFTLKVARDYPSGSCSTTNLYVNNSTWIETVTYTLPCTNPSAATLTFPANNANVQPGKSIHFTWDAPTTGTTPFTYTLYVYNGTSWQNWNADTNTYYDLQLSEHNSSTWCGTAAQWYVKATNSCGNTNSATNNLLPYPKYSGSTADYAITPSASCQTSGSHSIVSGGADYYSFTATAGTKYYFSTCSSDLSCGINTTWDTYLKIYGTNSSCTVSDYDDDGGVCTGGSFIDGWTCSTTGTYYLQITGYNSSAYGTYYLQYKACTPIGTLSLISPANNASVQPGKSTHYTWSAPTGTTPLNYTFYLWNGSAWLDFACDTNTYIDVQLNEYNSNSWCALSTQWYVTASNSCDTATSATRNINPYPKYSGSTTDYTIVPSGTCQTISHSTELGEADYYSFDAVAGNHYYFSTCGSDLGCGSNTGWDTYLKIYQTNSSCTATTYNDDGGACINNESFINGWLCSTSGTYYLQLTGYNSSAYGIYYLQYKMDCPKLVADLTGGSTPICYNTAPATFTATGTGGSGTYTYLWYNNTVSTGIATQTYTPTLTTNTAIYCAISSCGQTVNTSIYNVVVNPLPDANAGQDVSICQGSSTQLNATGGTSYEWSPATGLSATYISNPTASPSATITYTVEVKNQYGCIKTDDVIVTVNPIPEGSAGQDVSICFGDSNQLNAIGGISYIWAPATALSATNIANPIANPTATITYSVTVTNQYNCTRVDNMTVTVNPLPNANAGADTAICSGSSAQLNATGGTAYAWSPSTGLSATNIANPIASPTDTIAYFVSVTNQNNCSSKDTVVIIVYPVPVANADSNLVHYLTGLPYSATGGTPPYTYWWSPSNPLPIPDTITNFIFSVTDANGCSSSDTAIFFPSPNPGGCNELFISEYVQDTLNHNNAIELYNPTDSTIVLNNYYLGGTVGGTLSNPLFLIQLNGSIIAHGTFVITNPNADSTLLSKANMTSDSLNFNGQDVVALTYAPTGGASGMLIDKIGDFTIQYSDSGWAVSSGSTKNHTLIRQFSVVRGNPNWSSCQNEWNILPRSTFDSLGSFKNVCTPGDPHLAFSFANYQTNCDGNTYEFDIMAQADAPTTFNSCVIRIAYSPAQFGTNIVASGGVSVTRGNNFLNYIIPTVTDLSDSVIQISFGDSATHTSANGDTITSNADIMLHVSFHILSSQTSIVNFADTAYTSYMSNYTVATKTNDTTYAYANSYYSSTNYSNGFTSTSCVAQASLYDIFFSFQNITETVDSVSLVKHFTFDVFVNANDTGTYLQTAISKIKYSTTAFGSRILSHGNLTITRNPSFAAPAYNLQLMDNSDSVFTVQLTSNDSINNVPVPTIPIQLFHFSIIIDSCNSNAGIKFTDTATTALFSAYTLHAFDGSNKDKRYHVTHYVNELNVTLCKDTIYSFTSPVYPGTYYKGTTTNEWLLTINGSGFGARGDSGNVYFSDANSGGIYDTPLDSSDFISWTNTQIKIKMPSIIDTIHFATNKNRTPGGGAWYIKKDNGTSINSTNFIQMPYSIMNLSLLGKKWRLNTANITNDTTGIVFKLGPSIANDPDTMVEYTVRQALKDWACNTLINIRIKGYTNIDSSIYNDNVSVIHFSESGSLGLTKQRYATCETTTGDTVFFFREADIAILKNPISGSWYFKTDGALPAGRNDFFNAILHEVGHVNLLQHITDDSLMFYSSQFNPTQDISAVNRRGITYNDRKGGFDVVNKSNELSLDPACFANSATYIVISDSICEGATFYGIKKHNPSETKNEFLIYPNPFSSDGFNVSYHLTQKSTLQFSMLDFTGREIFRMKQKYEQSGYYNEHIETSQLSNGIYLFIINLNGNSQAYKIIKH